MTRRPGLRQGMQGHDSTSAECTLAVRLIARSCPGQLKTTPAVAVEHAPLCRGDPAWAGQPAGLSCPPHGTGERGELQDRERAGHRTLSLGLRRPAGRAAGGTYRSTPSGPGGLTGRVATVVAAGERAWCPSASRPTGRTGIPVQAAGLAGPGEGWVNAGRRRAAQDRRGEAGSTLRTGVRPVVRRGPARAGPVEAGSPVR